MQELSKNELLDITGGDSIFFDLGYYLMDDLIKDIKTVKSWFK